MRRIVLALALIALAVTGVAFIATRTGNVGLSIGDWRIVMTAPIFASVLVLAVAITILGWTVIQFLWRIAKAAP